MSEKEVLEFIEAESDVAAAAEGVFEAIVMFSDLEMLDGDAARRVASAWLQKFAGQ